MTTAELIQQWYDQVWNQANEDYITEKLDSNVIIHGLDSSGTTTGSKNFLDFYRNFKQNFPTVNVEINTLTHDEEYATVYCHVTARSTNSREVAFTGLSVVRFREGKIVEAWNNFDFLKMYQQLGHILVEPIEESNRN